MGLPDSRVPTEEGDVPGTQIVPIVENDDAIPKEVPLTPSGVERILEEQDKPKKKEERSN